MRYAAVITKDGKFTEAEFPDCPGCQTFIEGKDIAEMAQEALVGWLKAHLITGDAPPVPSRRAPKGKVLWVEVPPRLATKVAFRWARHQQGLTQAQLAKRAHMKQQQIALLEKPESNPTLESLERVAEALGLHLEVGLAGGDAR